MWTIVFQMQEVHDKQPGMHAGGQAGKQAAVSPLTPTHNSLIVSRGDANATKQADTTS